MSTTFSVEIRFVSSVFAVLTLSDEAPLSTISTGLQFSDDFSGAVLTRGRFAGLPSFGSGVDLGTFITPGSRLSSSQSESIVSIRLLDLRILSGDFIATGNVFFVARALALRRGPDGMGVFCVDGGGVVRDPESCDSAFD